MNEIETQGGAACFVVHNYEEADACLRTDETGFRGSVDDSPVDRRRRRAV
jgi:hypothetical protein